MDDDRTGRPVRPGLTRAQNKVFQAFEHLALEYGYPPTLREIGKAAGLASTSTVSHHLSVLEQKGYLRRGARQPRTAVAYPRSDPALGKSSQTGDRLTATDSRHTTAARCRRRQHRRRDSRRDGGRGHGQDPEAISRPYLANATQPRLSADPGRHGNHHWQGGRGPASRLIGGWEAPGDRIQQGHLPRTARHHGCLLIRKPPQPGQPAIREPLLAPGRGVVTPLTTWSH